MTSPDELEKNIGITFSNKDLLTEALTHRSYLNEYPRWPLPHNERLEYLGDAVLELLVSEELFTKFPTEPEGQLTVFRASLVNYQILAKVAERIGQMKHLFHFGGAELKLHWILILRIFLVQGIAGSIDLDLNKGRRTAWKRLRINQLPCVPCQN